MKDYLVARARIYPKHQEKLDHLCNATGLSQSEVLRALIENASTRPKPEPFSVIFVREDADNTFLTPCP